MSAHLNIGILVSTGPVALDQVCVDSVYEQKDEDGASLINCVEFREGIHTLEHAEKVGLGVRNYALMDIG